MQLTDDFTPAPEYVTWLIKRVETNIPKREANMKKARLTFGRKHFESSLKKPSRDPDFAKRVHGKNQSE